MVPVFGTWLVISPAGTHLHNYFTVLYCTVPSFPNSNTSVAITGLMKINLAELKLSSESLSSPDAADGSPRFWGGSHPCSPHGSNSQLEFDVPALSPHSAAKAAAIKFAMGYTSGLVPSSPQQTTHSSPLGKLGSSFPQSSPGSPSGPMRRGAAEVVRQRRSTDHGSTTDKGFTQGGILTRLAERWGEH